MVSSRGLTTCRSCHEGLALDLHVECTACEAGCAIYSRNNAEFLSTTKPFSSTHGFANSSKQVSPSPPYHNSSSAIRAISVDNVSTQSSTLLPDPLEYRLPPIKTFPLRTASEGNVHNELSSTAGKTACLPTFSTLQQQLQAALPDSASVNIPSIFSMYRGSVWANAAPRPSIANTCFPEYSSSMTSSGGSVQVGQSSDRKARRGTSSTLKTKSPHNNTPYTEEQIHWIIHQKNSGNNYGRIAVLFMSRWPGKSRTSDAMSSCFYRHQIAPHLNPQGGLMYDRSGDVIVKMLKKRDQDKAAQDKSADGYRFRDYFTFLTCNPEEALTYDWVTPMEKERARQIIASRGGLRLPGSTKASRAHADDRPVEDKAYDRCAQDVRIDELEVLDWQASEFRRLQRCCNCTETNLGHVETLDSHSLELHKLNGCGDWNAHSTKKKTISPKDSVTKYELSGCPHCAKVHELQAREWQKLHGLPPRNGILNSDIAPEYEERWSLMKVLQEYAAHDRYRRKKHKDNVMVDGYF